LLRKGCKNIDEDEIRHIVESNDKKRFEIEERKHHKFIRATQGHSMKVVNTEELLTKITDPLQYPTVVHGTFSKFWGSIKAGGLKRMTRNHIHFAPGMPKEEGVVSGMRGSCDIIIEIDMGAAMKDGI
jgi:2'-phosphotransferase